MHKEEECTIIMYNCEGRSKEMDLETQRIKGKGIHLKVQNYGVGKDFPLGTGWEPYDLGLKAFQHWYGPKAAGLF